MAQIAELQNLLEYVSKHADEDGFAKLDIFSLHEKFGEDIVRFAIRKGYLKQIGLFVQLTRQARVLVSK